MPAHAVLNNLLWSIFWMMDSNLYNTHLHLSIKMNISVNDGQQCLQHTSSSLFTITWNTATFLAIQKNSIDSANPSAVSVSSLLDTPRLTGMQRWMGSFRWGKIRMSRETTVFKGKLGLSRTEALTAPSPSQESVAMKKRSLHSSFFSTINW